MDSHEIIMKGAFKPQTLSEPLGTATSEDARREVYYEGKRYFCNGSNWLTYNKFIQPANVPYAYNMGGYAAGSIIQRITFPFDSGFATYVGNLGTIKTESAAFNSSQYAFSISGTGTRIDRIAFPFDSGASTYIGNTSTSRKSSSGCNCSTYGYTFGGSNGASISSIIRFTFPFDSTPATDVGYITSGIYLNAGVNSTNYGFSMGGDGFSSIIHRIEFPFDSGAATTVGNLVLGKQRISSTGINSSNYGYLPGGQIDTAYSSTVDRITFPFNSGTSTVTGNLTISVYGQGGCNSTNYGFSMGGYDESYYFNVERITFPFDSGTASLVGSLSSSNYFAAISDGTDFVSMFI